MMIIFFSILLLNVHLISGDGVSRIDQDQDNDGKKCGNPGNAGRLFDLRGAEANEAACTDACLSDSSCVAFSGIFGSWCIGCKNALSSEHGDAVSYKKSQYQWSKVFSQDISGGLFKDAADVLNKNPTDPDAKLFSVLDTLASYRLSDGYFNLKMCFPELEGQQCNIWAQTSNPALESTITGFKSISLPYEKDSYKRPFVGMGVNIPGKNGAAFMDDAPKESNWWNAIGTFRKFYDQIPGPVTGTAGIKVNKVEMYALAPPPPQAPAPGPYECTGSGSDIIVLLEGPQHQIEINSQAFPNYPDQPAGSKCVWKVSALHGANVKVKALEVSLADNCTSTSTLSMYDESDDGESRLAYPGVKALCHEGSTIPSVETCLTADGTLTITSTPGLRHRILLEATAPTECPVIEAEDQDCPMGPCCGEADCYCQYLAGSEPLDLEITKAGQCSFDVIAAPGAQVSVNFLEMKMPPQDPSQGCEAWVQLEDHDKNLGSFVSMQKYCGLTVPNFPGPSVITSGSNALTVSYFISEANLNKGQGFKAAVTAVNPLCTPMSFIHKFGDAPCEETCGSANRGPGEQVITPCPWDTTSTTPASPTTTSPGTNTGESTTPGGSTVTGESNVTGGSTVPGGSTTPEGPTTPETTTPLICIIPPEKFLQLTLVKNGTEIPVIGAEVNITGPLSYQTHHSNQLGEVQANGEPNDVSLFVSISAEDYILQQQSIMVDCENVDCEDCFVSLTIDMYSAPAGPTTETPTTDVDGSTIIPTDSSGSPISTTMPCETDMTYTLSVIDNQNRTIPGAEVSVSLVVDSTEILVAEVIADENGDVSIPINIDGNYNVTVKKDGWLDNEFEMVVENCTHEDVHEDIVLEKLPPPCTAALSIHIRNHEDLAVVGAEVSVTIAGLETPLEFSPLTSDENGHINKVMDPEMVTLRVTADGYYSKDLNKNVTCDNETVIVLLDPIPATTTPTTQDPTESTTPSCYDSNANEPIILKIDAFDLLTLDPVASAQATITLQVAGEEPVVIATNASISQEWSTTVLRDGVYNVMVAADGYETATSTIDIICDPSSCSSCTPSLSVPLKQSSGECSQAKLLTVKVSDANTQEMVPGAQVLVSLNVGSTTRPVSPYLSCTAGSDSILQCGYDGINEDDCISSSCCWNGLVQQAASRLDVLSSDTVTPDTVTDSADSVTEGEMAAAAFVNVTTNSSDTFTGLIIPSYSCQLPGGETSMDTDTEGLVSMPLPGEGDYTVTITREGFEPLVYNYAPALDDSCDPVILQLSLSQDPLCTPQGLPLGIKVVDSSTELPIPEATIKLIQTASIIGPSQVEVGGTLLTDVSGIISPILYNNGTYRVSVEAPGYNDYSEEITIPAIACENGLNVTIRLEPTTGGVIVCPDAEVVISVFDLHTGNPVTGVGLDITYENVTSQIVALGVNTDDLGAVKVPVTRLGQYMAKLNSSFTPPYEAASNTTELPCCECPASIVLFLDQEHCELDLNITVMDNTTGMLIEGAQVTLLLTDSLTGPSLTEEGPIQITSVLGLVTFGPDLINGNYSVKVNADKYNSNELPLSIDCNLEDCASCKVSLDVELQEQFCANRTMKLQVGNSRDNTPLPGAQVEMIQETHNGPNSLGVYTVAESGEVLLPIIGNGHYTVLISADGFMNVTTTLRVAVTPDECELLAPFKMIPMPTPIEQGCVQVSLTWAEEPKDLDLISYRVNQYNNEEQCITDECMKENEQCDGITKDKDVQDGGDTGAETITYCDVDEYSNMIWVDDRSGQGASLLNSEATLVITNDLGETQEVKLRPGEGQAEARYWLAGCLTTTTDSFDFIVLNQFRDEEPNLEQPLHCHSRTLLENKPAVLEANIHVSVSSTQAASTCPICEPTAGHYHGSRQVTISGFTCQNWTSQSPHAHTQPEEDNNYCRNPDNGSGGAWCYTTDPDKRWEYCANCPDECAGAALAGAMISLTTSHETYSRVTEEDGQLVLPVTEDGDYSLLAKMDGYVPERLNFSLSCDNLDDVCATNVQISMMTLEEDGGLRIKLNWDGDEERDLDLHLVQVEKAEPRASCHTYWNDMAGCPDTELDQNLGEELGNNQARVEILDVKAETVTVGNFAGKSSLQFLVYVDDNTATGADLSSVLPQITITLGNKVVSSQMPTLPSNQAASRFWMVGALEVVGTSFRFSPANTWSLESPWSNAAPAIDNWLSSNPTLTPPFCEGIDLTLTVMDALTHLAPAGGEATVIKVSEESELVVAEAVALDTQGVLRVPITEAGHYEVQVNGAGYIAARQSMFIDCDPVDCGSCAPSMTVGLSPALGANQLRLTLGGEQDMDNLDMYAVHRDDSFISCVTTPDQSSDCPNIDTVTGADGQGIQTITFNQPTAGTPSVYTIFVEWNAPATLEGESLAETNAFVSLTDGSITEEIKIDASSFGGERRWLAGCLLLKGGEVYPTFQLIPEKIFFTERPDVEVPNICLEAFDLMPEATKWEGQCIKDAPSRVLPVAFGSSGYNTPEYCIAKCKSHEYLYAGVQYTRQCFCGNTVPEAGDIVDSSECDKKCPGDTTKYCGGTWRMNTYETGYEDGMPPADGNRCDCTYSYGGCKIKTAPPAGYSCTCKTKGWFGCSGSLRRCNPTEECPSNCRTKTCCKVGQGNCYGYSWWG